MAGAWRGAVVVSQQFPRLGTGLGFRGELKADIFLNRKEIDCLEIIADHYLEPTAKATL
ncbi:MAG: hypothetical protein HW416_1512, partial [Chloroflexi bacterium]|nr:hypothetical protein [Chloroflexota bacterium]